jgi:4-amino-4-deoxy-L-arabinose transferase-like glycosyltransferase
VSTFSQAPEASATERAAIPTATEVRTDRTRRWVSIIVTSLVLAWSVVEVISLLGRHTTGPELYGVLVAAIAVATGVLSLALVTSNRQRVLATAAALVLWAFVAIGGIAGSYAHIVGAPANEGPVDPRPRPIAAPLIFTGLGLVGGAALFYGQRLGAARIRES